MNHFRKILTRQDPPQAAKPPGVEEGTLLLVQSSFPTFKTNSKKIAIEMYRRIFHLHPSLKSLFSLEFLDARSKSSQCPLGHHGLDAEISAQAQILADSILNFCANVYDMSAFEPVLTRICAKHVSRQVLPEHYTVVATCFSEAVREVIGEQVSKDELEAWDKAVVVLAGILIEREKYMYKALETTPGAWKGFRSFQVSKWEDFQGMPGVSVVLEPQDNGALAEYESGQYVCMRAETSEYGTIHRNIALCPRMSVDEAVNTALLSSYQIRLAVPAKQKEVNDCRVNTDLVVYEHIQNGGEVQISTPVGGYVQRPAGTRSRPAGRTNLRAAAMAKSAGLGGSRMAALQGVRSPLAEAVNNDLADGVAQLRVNQLKGNGPKKPSPMSRFAGLNGGY